MTRFGEILAELRQDRGLTQETLAKVLFVTAGTISNYENSAHFPDIEKLTALADFFDVPLDYLLGRCASSLPPGTLDEPLVLEYAAKTGRVVTVEEHTVIGGLGGAIAELLSEKQPTRMKRVGVNDCFGKSAKASDALEMHGLNAASVADAVRVLMRD